MRKLCLLALALIVLSVPLVHAQQAPTIAEIIQGDENFSTFIEVLTAADMLETLNAEGTYTVFVPTNAAFEALPPGMLDGVMSSPPSVQAVLGYHLVEGTFFAADIATMDSLPTVFGAPLIVTVDGEDIFLNETVTITQSDIEASNGVVHVIDAVLVPARPGEAAPAGNTFADLIAAREDLAFLGTALSLTPEFSAALGLPLLEDEPPGVFLAPNDDAFLAFDEDLRNAAIADPLLLTSIFLYHILPDASVLTPEAMAGLAESPLELETGLPDATVTLSMDADGNLLVNEAKIVEPDIQADNGIMLIIDQVLIPPDDTLLTQEEYDAVMGAIREALAAAGGASEGSSTGEEGPALDVNWGVIGNGFDMAELDTADDFFVTVTDPHDEPVLGIKELSGVQIINWTAAYKYTGYIVSQYLPADVLIWMNEQDPSTFENISDETLKALAPEELAKLPEELQARVQ